MQRHDQRGMSLIEVLLALFLVSFAMMGAVYFVANTSQGTKHNKTKEFAVQKAISMFDELKALVENTTGSDITILDDYDDGTTYKTVLTTQDGVSNANDKASGNTEVDGHWLYERQISVQKFPSLQTNDIRLVNVRVYGIEINGPKTPRRLLAEVSGVIRTIADKYPPSEVYDVYCLAIENVPGWWVYMANLIPFVENAISDLQARNPGLVFRTHWIQHLSYGRDPLYTPFINNAHDSNYDIDWAYVYPGLMPSGSAVNYYYVPTQFSSRISIDGTLTNGYDAEKNPHPYALADGFNHAMRYPDEKALFDQRVADGVEDAGRPSWRLLLEDMYSHPENYTNAILINVHGELFPFPPLRNFSDPAKDPEGHPNVRVVTHPEQLRYDNSQGINLRVYSYLTDPTASTNQLNEPISVLIKGLHNPAGLFVTDFEGGLDLNPVDSVVDPYTSESYDNGSSYTGDQYYTVEDVTDGTLVRLYNSILKTPCVGGATCTSGGLPSGKRLYAQEYIPTPLNTGTGDFTRNLTVAGDMTKNTARWVITIPATDLSNDSLWTVETRIGDDLNYGTVYPTADRPLDVSRTYVWRGTDTWVFGDGTSTNPPHLPLTERFQFMGDPRHSPYADIKKDYNSATNPLGMGYNRYFDDFHDASGNKASDNNFWPGFSGVRNDATNNNDGWSTSSGYLEIDVNRAFQILRSSLMKSNALWTTMSGFSYYYIGVGNEIGYDSANGFANSIPMSRKPFDGGSGTRNEMSITDAQTGGVKYIKEANDGWWGLNWLGELFPDKAWDDWSDDGNIPSGTGSDHYLRVLRSSINFNLPTGTTFLGSLRRTNAEGSTAFFSIGTTASCFHHTYSDNTTGDLTTKGTEISNNYNFPVPTTANIFRPFNTNRSADGGVPVHYQAATYTGGTNPSSTMVAQYYGHATAGLIGSSLQTLTGSGNNNAFVVVNGLAMTTSNGSAFIGRWSFLTLLHSFFEAGLYSGNGRIVQVPRVAITAPNDLTDLNNPSQIHIAWDSTWKRWDGNKYASSYSSTFSESKTVRYALLYSNDSGAHWFFMQDDSPAVPGERPADSTLLTTSSSYDWTVNASDFPRGSYLIRVEAFRDGYPLHYSYHQYKLYIKR